MDRMTNLIRPKKIFMGEKDFQQLHLVKKYIEKKYKSIIIPCKTIRGKSTIALSSRNLLLTKKNLYVAGKLTKSLILFKKNLSKIKFFSHLIDHKKESLIKSYNVKIEYIELRNKFTLKKTNNIKNSKIFIAYYLGKIRMIDNF